MSSKGKDPRAGYLLGGITASRVSGYRAHAPRTAMPMLLGIRGGCNGPMLRKAACPTCGVRGNFRRHGHYERWEAAASASGRKPDRRVRIDVVLCRSCRATHALIPPDLVPRSPYSKPFRRLLAQSAYGPYALSVRQLCDRFGLETRTLYRILRSRDGPVV